MSLIRKTLVGLTLAAGVVAAVTFAARSDQATPAHLAAPVAIPFESLNGLILFPIRVNGSEPLTVILDSGAKPSIVSLERAKALALDLGASVSVGGTGAGSSTGAFVKNATLTLDALPGFSHPVTLAISLDAIARRTGRRLDGIVGTDFMRAFVVELDYEKQILTLHDARTFSYHGPGTALPMTVDSNGHPTFTAIVTPVGRPAIEATVKLDIGASGAVTLHTPFVQQHGLPGPNLTTTRVIGVTGMGGRSSGRLGRLASLQVAGVTLERPTVVFSADTSGANANPLVAGRVGAKIASRFRVFLDFTRGQLILEPHATTNTSFDVASAGIAFEADGPEYRTVRVIDVLEDGPGALAGIQHGDVLTAIDGKPASTVTMLDVIRRLERVAPCELTLQRAGRFLTLTVTPK